jgi:hypothetical protein
MFYELIKYAWTCRVYLNNRSAVLCVASFMGTRQLKGAREGRCGPRGGYAEASSFIDIPAARVTHLNLPNNAP